MIEVLMIVAILGIITALVIPEYGNATANGRDSALLSNLQMFRKQISLYQLQHKGYLPGQNGNASWEQALLNATNEDGDLYTSEMKTAGVSKRGPYLDGVPVNSFNGLDTVRLDGAAAGANTHGWRFDTVTGAIHADDNQLNEDGLPHSEL